jgi:hypothetical protein
MLQGIVWLRNLLLSAADGIRRAVPQRAKHARRKRANAVNNGRIREIPPRVEVSWMGLLLFVVITHQGPPVAPSRGPRCNGNAATVTTSLVCADTQHLLLLYVSIKE